MRAILSVPFVLLIVAAPQLPAQDPTKEIQEIARKIDEQLQEIDRLLLDSSKKASTRPEQKELLQKASEGSAAADASIEELIKKLTEMKNQGSPSQSQDGSGQQQPQDGQQQPQGGQQPNNQTRRENQTPDHVDQGKPGEQQGKQQKPQGQQESPRPQDGKPMGGQESPDTPENRTGTRPPDSETGPGQRGAGDETWGELQPYMNRLKSRGSSPAVPEKFRKYWQAYLKSRQGSDGK
ncbi:MAG: hypothetical protein JNL08_11255 [Planctomycetes bacterium]|nr:hypothetical protein [Planctomycetota bacterium]